MRLMRPREGVSVLSEAGDKEGSGSCQPSAAET
jgi:hypothetical protein